MQITNLWLASKEVLRVCKQYAQTASLKKEFNSFKVMAKCFKLLVKGEQYLLVTDELLKKNKKG